MWIWVIIVWIVDWQVQPESENKRRSGAAGLQIIFIPFEAHGQKRVYLHSATACNRVKKAWRTPQKLETPNLAWTFLISEHTGVIQSAGRCAKGILLSCSFDCGFLLALTRLARAWLGYALRKRKSNQTTEATDARGSEASRGEAWRTGCRIDSPTNPTIPSPKSARNAIATGWVGWGEFMKMLRIHWQTKVKGLIREVAGTVECVMKLMVHAWICWGITKSI